MTISAELSYYPLHSDDFPGPIREFIDRLAAYPDIEVRTNGMSTQVFGEFADVMRILATELERSFVNPYSVFVLKIVNTDLRIYPQDPKC